MNHPVLEGRRAIITGASRGLGEALTRTFWEAGASLLLVARSRDALKQVADGLPPRDGQTVRIFPADLAQPGAADAIARCAEEQWREWDILVNNAGTQGPIGPLWTNDWSEWVRTLQINLLSPVALCRASVPHMRTGGVIINVAGGGAATSRPNFSAYATSKAAIVRFTEVLADELRPRKIRVNAIAPGVLPTELLRSVLHAGAERAGERDYAAARAALERSDPYAFEAPARLCVWLASPEASEITGKFLSAVWDPWPELPQHMDDLVNSDVYTLRRIVPRDRGLSWGC